MDESEDKRLLLAQAYIEADGGLTLYRPGDLLPSDSPDAAAWVEAVSYTHLTLPTNREV